MTRFVRCTAVLCAMLLCSAIHLPGQWFGLGSGSGSTPIILTGSYRLLGQSSSRQGTFQQKPPDFARAEFTPTIVTYGIPISATFLYSTEQSGIRQEINAFALNLDPQMLRTIIEQRAFRALDAFMASDSGSLLQEYQRAIDDARQNGTELADSVSDRIKQFQRIQEIRSSANGDIRSYSEALQELGLMSSVERFMLWLPKIGYGTIFPTFTPLTLSGARVEGVNVEWNPGNAFYINVVKGTTQRPLARTDSDVIDTTLFTLQTDDDFGRSLLGARIGVGTPAGDRFMLTGVYTSDDVSSLPGGDTIITPAPQRNIISSIDFRVSPIPNIWTLEAEVGGSLTVGDLNAPRITVDGLPEPLLKLIDSSSAVYADWSASAGTQLSIPSTNTRITGSVRRVGTGYRAMGVPNMRVDVLRYDARLSQSILKRQLTLSVFARQDRDNLVPLKRVTTLTSSVGVDVGIMPRRLPYLRLSYLPYMQESNTTDSAFAYANKTAMWTATAGYSYRIDDMSASTQATFSRQTSVTSMQLSDYAVTSANVFQSLAFVFPLNISCGLGVIRQQTEGFATTIVTTDASAAYALSDILSASGGITLALDSEQGDRMGFSLSINARIPDIADVDIRAERSLFQEYAVPAMLGGSYRENIVRVTVSKSW